jgi:hypothetical protein
MAALDRRSYQGEVERLLDQIRTNVETVRRMKAYGAQGPALLEHKHAVAQARERLAHLVGASTTRRPLSGGTPGP